MDLPIARHFHLGTGCVVTEVFAIPLPVGVESELPTAYPRKRYLDCLERIRAEIDHDDNVIGDSSMKPTMYCDDMLFFVLIEHSESRARQSFGIPLDIPS